MAKEQSLPKAWGEINALKSGKLDKDNEGNIKIKGVAPKIEIFPNSPIQGAQGIIDFMDADGQHVRLRHNSYDSTRAPFGLHIERHPDNIQPSNRAYLDVEGQIFADGGGRVYNTNYKPTAADVGSPALLATITTQDWNTIKSPGYYKVQQMSGANKPSGYTYGILEVGRGSDNSEDRSVQIYYPHSESQGTQRRMCNGTGWQSWVTSFDTGNSPMVKAQNGYCKLANGLIIQWGSISLANKPDNFEVILPIAYPTTFVVSSWGASGYTSAHQTSRGGYSGQMDRFRIYGLNSPGSTTARMLDFFAIGY